MTLTRKLNVTKLHINSEVQCRFATTEINSRVENVSAEAEEAEFVANLPDGAFITYFEMEIDGKVIVGDVREKQEAKMVYDAAKSREETAGHVAQVARATNTFNISVNIAPYSFARFKLVYQELLQRVRGAYKHQINVHPGQAVEDLQVNVIIKENNPITILHVPAFAAKLSDKSNKELLLLKGASDVKVDIISDMERSIKWHPSAINQAQYLTNDMLDGQLILLYDVDRNDDEVLVVDGHFIHFLAPKNLDIGSKNIVFALDISGSMGDGKLEQTKTAMRSILNQLRETDRFSILCFNTQLEVWKNKPVLATKANVSEGIGFVDAQRPAGGTDIDQAVQEGIKWLKGVHSKEILASILVLLTDGQHNSGKFSSQHITPRVIKSLKSSENSVKIYGLGFGNDADFNLLRNLSAKTGGFARKIYAASDAALQLDSFYAEISSPLLTDLNVKYVNPNVQVVSTVRNIRSDTLFDGSELVLIGKMDQLSLKEGDELFEWHSRCCNGPKIIRCCYRPWRLLPIRNKGEVSKTAGNFVERSWAYLTVKNLLEMAKADSEESKNLKRQALQMALKYKFVTELTSMVVTQEQEMRQFDRVDGETISFFGAPRLQGMASRPTARCRLGTTPMLQTCSFNRSFGMSYRERDKFESRSGSLNLDSHSTLMSATGGSRGRGGAALFGRPCALPSPPQLQQSMPPAPESLQASSLQRLTRHKKRASRPADVFGDCGKEKACDEMLDNLGSDDDDEIEDECDSIFDRKKSKTLNGATRVQLSNLIGLEKDKLEEMCEDQPPTLIEKLLSTSIDRAIEVTTKMIGSSTTNLADIGSKDKLLLSLLATLVASTLQTPMSAESLLKALFERTTNGVYIREIGDGQFVVECDAGQLTNVSPLLLAIQTMIRLHLLCDISSQNQLVQFLSVAVGSTKNSAIETLAKAVIAELDH